MEKIVHNLLLVGNCDAFSHLVQFLELDLPRRGCRYDVFKFSHVADACVAPLVHGLHIFVQQQTSAQLS